MPYFGPHSRARLKTCHPELQRLFNQVIKDYDCAILCGYRDEAAQEEAVASGASNAHYPDSPHNKIPSLAADVAPCPINWDDIPAFLELRNYVEQQAKRLTIEIKPIIQFKNVKGKIVTDYPHFELET
jgi:hypothetical protein